MARFRPWLLLLMTMVTCVARLPRLRLPNLRPNNNKQQHKKSAPSDLTVATKTAVGVGVETAVLVGFVEAARNVPVKLPLGLRPVVVAWFLVAYFSSTFNLLGDLLEWVLRCHGSDATGLGSAARQQLNPREVPDMAWYAGLSRPWWEPPGWVFPIMWLIVSKPTQLAAVRRLEFLKSDTTLAFTLYASQLALGDAWNRVFFGRKRLNLSVAVILAFDAALIATTVAFAQIDKTAALLMCPTLAWVTVASALNIAVASTNKEKKE